MACFTGDDLHEDISLTQKEAKFCARISLIKKKKNQLIDQKRLICILLLEHYQPESFNFHLHNKS